MYFIKNFYTLQLHDVWWNGSQWVDSKLSNTKIDSAPAALYGFAQGRIDVFYTGKDGYLYDTWWNGSKWVENKISNTKLNSIPAPLAGFAQGRMDVFYVGPDMTL